MQLLITSGTTLHFPIPAAAVASKHASKLGEVAATISSNAEERLAQQGPALPAAKQLDVPQPTLVGQLCCPPELVLVEHFRVQRKQILEVSCPVTIDIDLAC
jgi:phage tail protein X